MTTTTVGWLVIVAAIAVTLISAGLKYGDDRRASNRLTYRDDAGHAEWVRSFHKDTR